MAKKVVWLMVSCLMAISLVMASCGPAAEEEEEEEEVVIGEEEEEEEEETLPSPDKPKYGGTITYRSVMDPTNFDSATMPHPEHWWILYISNSWAPTGLEGLPAAELPIMPLVPAQ